MSFIHKSTIPAHLRGSALANSLPKAELRQLDQIATLETITEGRKIIAQSTPGRECFIIVEGDFEVQGPGVSATIGAGEVAGELALLTGRQRNASVVATSDASVYVLHPREFATLLSEAPQFCTQVVRAASDRLGSQPITLPAQFVSRDKSPLPTRPWSQQLAEVPTSATTTRPGSQQLAEVPTSATTRSQWSQQLAEVPRWRATL